MRQILIAIFLAANLFHATSQAREGGREGGKDVDIRGVGNGGGLAEMRVIYLFQNVDRFLRFCLTENNTCRIDQATAIEWQKLASPQNETAFEISFVNEVANENGFFLTGKEIKISNKRLYVDQKTPQNFAALLSYVVSLKQELAGSSFSFQRNLDIASNAFKNLRIEEQTHKVTGISSLLSLGQLKVFDGLSSHILLSLEDEEKTFSLNELVNQSLPCGHISNWNFNQFSSSLISKTLYLYGFASASCAGLSTDRRIVIKAELDDDFLFNPGTIQVRFFAL